MSVVGAVSPANLHPSAPPQPRLTYNKSALEKNGMKYCRLGNTGVVVSRIALGLMSYAVAPRAGDPKWTEWAIEGESGEIFIQQALDAGINLFDTAEIYSDGRSEEFFGNALKKFLGSSKFTREDLVISTKIYPNRTINPASEFGGIQRGLSRKAIFAAVEGSLKRLQIDYIDIYYIHRFDPNTAIEETMRALHDLVVAGKVRYLGASSMFLWQFTKMQACAEKNGWTKFSVMQNHYNAIYREEEREMIPFCIDSGVALLPWSPLASGVLVRPPGITKGSPEASARLNTDKIQHGRYFKDGDEEVVAAVQAIAKERNLPPAQIALAWLLQKPGVTAPIIGATKPNHIADAVAAVHVQLSPEEVKRIEQEYKPHAIAGHS